MSCHQESAGGIIESSVRCDLPNENGNIAIELLNAFKRHSDKTLLSYSGAKRDWTGQDIIDRATRIATCLIERFDIKPNDVVLSTCDHTDHEIIFALGAIFAGAAICGCNPDDGYEETKVMCELTNPKLIVAQSRLQDTISRLKSNISKLKSTHVIYIDSSRLLMDDDQFDFNNNSVVDASDITFEEMLEVQGKNDIIEETINCRIDPSEHSVYYMMTSGSTGRPKIVPTSHSEALYGLYSIVSSTKYPLGSSKRPDMEGEPLMKVDSSDVIAGDLPLDHGAGINIMFMSFLLGSRFVVMPSYRADIFWQNVNDYRITVSIASTTFAYRLLSRLRDLIVEEKIINRWDLSCFRYMACAGAKMMFTDLIREIQLTYKQLLVIQCYGCTETGFISILPASMANSNAIVSVGYLFPGVKVKLVDVDSGDVLMPEFDTKGELLVWARSKFKRYLCYEDDEVSKSLANFHDGENFYKTGDLVHFDVEGRIYIHGRIKDTLFLMEDWKILPAELENLIDSHPLVDTSIVVGVADVELPGCDAPRAFVKLVSSELYASHLTDKQADNESDNEEHCKLLLSKLQSKDFQWIAQDIYQFVAARTAEPKHLKGGVRIVEEFPRVGLLNKVDRKALKLID